MFLGQKLALGRVRPLFSGLLDKFTGAAAAYSLRKLSKDTTNVVRVRRSSDDTEQDFTAAQVSDGSLVDFCNNGTSDLYGERMYFDGVDDYVALSSSIDLGTSNYTASANIVPSSMVGNQLIVGLRLSGSGGVLGLNGSSQAFVRITNSPFSTHAANLDSALSVGTEYNLEFRRINTTTIDVYVDGQKQANSITIPSTAEFNGIGLIGNGSTSDSRRFNGIISDVNINGVASYQGYGNTDADWEDQIGSNDGTVNGSPALYTGQGFDGFVTTWYDQSGNSNDAEQTTTTAQPQIVSAGSLVTENGLPAFHTDGVDDFLTFVSAGGTTRSTFLAFSSTLNTTARKRFFGEPRFDGVGDNAGYNFEGRGDKTGDPLTFSLLNDAVQEIDSAANPTIGHSLFSLEINSEGRVYQNGSSIINTVGTIQGDYIEGSIAATTNGAFPSNTKYQEIIIYDSDQSANRVEIESNINDYYGIY